MKRHNIEFPNYLVTSKGDIVRVLDHLNRPIYKVKPPIKMRYVDAIALSYKGVRVTRSYHKFLYETWFGVKLPENYVVTVNKDLPFPKNLSIISNDFNKYIKVDKDVISFNKIPYYRIKGHDNFEYIDFYRVSKHGECIKVYDLEPIKKRGKLIRVKEMLTKRFTAGEDFKMYQMSVYKKLTLYPHLAVANTFLDLPEEPARVIWKDNNRLNNSVKNLEWKKIKPQNRKKDNLT
jgi:hypothetical protein